MRRRLLEPGRSEAIWPCLPSARARFRGIAYEGSGGGMRPSWIWLSRSGLCLNHVAREHHSLSI